MGFDDAKRAIKRKRRVRERLHEFQRGVCGICAQTLFPNEETHIDHIVPVALGGANEVSNLQLVHGYCNRVKGSSGTAAVGIRSLRDRIAIRRAPQTPEASAGLNLIVPTGLLRDDRFVLAPWQVEWVQGAFAPGVREAGLSIARKNGKSSLVAAILLDFLIGVRQLPGWRAVVCSLTAQLAGELRKLVEDLARASGYLEELGGGRSKPSPGHIGVFRAPFPGRIIGPEGEVTLLAADKATGHAVGADLAIVDEAGLLQESHRDLWNAMLSSTSGRDGRFWAISVRGDGPMFSELADRELDPAVFWREYAAEEHCELDDPEAWAAANPGLATGIKSLAYMRDRSRAVLQVPADQNAFRSLDLNQPQLPTREALCAPNDWAACEVEHVDDLPARAGPCLVGFDCGMAQSMTASAAYWPETGRLEVRAAFPEVPTLKIRGKSDGVGGIYEKMHDRGELELHPGRVVDVGSFLQDVASSLKGSPVACAAADSYRRTEAEQALETADADWPMSWRANMGGKEGTHDVGAFQKAVLRGEVRVVKSYLLRQGLKEAEVKYNSVGHPSLGRYRAKGRIDVVAASVLALGIAAAQEGRQARPEDFILSELYDSDEPERESTSHESEPERESTPHDSGEHLAE